MTSKYGQIFILPGRRILIREIKRLREALTQAVFEYDELIYKDCTYLENQFYFRLGTALQSLLNAHLCSVFLERKYQIVSHFTEELRETKLQQLDKDLASYKQLVLQVEDKIRAAELWAYEGFDQQKALLMRQYYRQIIAKVHPLLHPLQSKAQHSLYQKALAAYKHENLEILELIIDSLEEEYAQSNPLSLPQLFEERESLLRALYETRRQLAIKRADFPYLLRGFILIEEQGEKMRQAFIERQQMLLTKNKQLESEIAKYTKN